MSTTRMSAARTGTLGTRHNRRGGRRETGASAQGGSSGGKRAFRSSGDSEDCDAARPGSPGGGEVTERLFASTGAAPAGATELQSGGTYVRFRRIGENAGNRGAFRNDHWSKTVDTAYVRVLRQ